MGASQLGLNKDAAERPVAHSGQFCHVATYARKVSSLSGSAKTSDEGKPAGKRAKIWTVADIAAEAARVDPLHFPHVPHPKPPTLIAGVDVANLESICDAMLVDATQANGKALRKDTHVLLAAIYSIDVKGCDYELEKDRCDQFFADSLAWHEKMYGKVVSAVMHEDEGYIHIHCLGVSHDARGLIPGWRAKRAAIKEALEMGSSKMDANRAGNVAYKKAMVEVQDSYFFEVGAVNGLARYGNRRMRYQPGSGESIAQKRQREEFAVRERAERECRERKERQLALDIEEQRRMSQLATERFADAEKKRLNMLERAIELRKYEKFVEKKQSDFEDRVERLLVTPQYIKEEKLKEQTLALNAATLKIRKLENFIEEQNSFIDKLQNIIKDLKEKLKNFFGRT